MIPALRFLSASGYLEESLIERDSHDSFTPTALDHSAFSSGMSIDRHTSQ